jgi:hypothetical protein
MLVLGPQHCLLSLPSRLRSRLRVSVSGSETGAVSRPYVRSDAVRYIQHRRVQRADQRL